VIAGNGAESTPTGTVAGPVAELYGLDNPGKLFAVGDAILVPIA